MHCLVQCVFAQTCWTSIHPGINFNNYNKFEDWFEFLLGEHKDRIEEVAKVCWGISKACNNLLQVLILIRGGVFKEAGLTNLPV